MQETNSICSKKPQIDERYLRPREAEHKLKMAAGINQTIWINGVCGSGKTSFVADYLKRKRYDYYSAHEVLPEQITIQKTDPNTKTRIIIIDDLYGIKEPDLQNGWYEKIEEMIKTPDLWLILISRSGIPAWLYTLSIRSIFYRIEEEDLMLTKEQVKEYLLL